MSKNPRKVSCMDSLFDLTDRRALVTGAGQNLGAGIARTLAHVGAHVVVNDIVEVRAQAVADEIHVEGGSASIALFDVTDFESVMTGVDAVGPIDVLVNNAGNAGAVGWTGDGPFVETTPADWSMFFDVNLYGVMHCVRAVTPSMIENNWGRVDHDHLRRGPHRREEHGRVRSGEGRCRRIHEGIRAGGRPLRDHRQQHRHRDHAPSDQ